MNETVVEHLVILLRLKRSEQTVPNDEHSAVVAIDAVPIARVMHAVVRRGRENPVERT